MKKGMKKVWLGSLIGALAVEITGAAANLQFYAITGDFLVYFPLQGGEWKGESGFGMLLNHTYPMSTFDHPVSGSVWIDFDPASLIFTLIFAFVHFFVIFFIIHKVKEKRAQRRAENSAGEKNEKN